jgi:hypothetical protein
MCDENAIMRDTQLQVRQELDRRKIPLKLVASKAGVPMSTFMSWFPADGKPQLMSIADLNKLCRALPLDLASLFMPDNIMIVDVPEGINHNDLARHAHDYLQTKTNAHDPDSEAGVEIGPNEQAELDNKAARLAVAS